MMLKILKSLFVAPGERIHANDAPLRVKDGALLVDVREPGEFSGGHAPKAINLPLSRLRHDGVSAMTASVGGAREILLVCHSGARSRMAQALLADDPDHRYVDVAGGMSAWVRAGLPVTRP